ncbi:hypothetical protein [Lysobacter gummosus]|uniref:hypothetical protein n=1 Tax=Lysobacter gummosus TaxID=262324 RepID=UPI0036303392
MATTRQPRKRWTARPCRRCCAGSTRCCRDEVRGLFATLAHSRAARHRRRYAGTGGLTCIRHFRSFSSPRFRARVTA